MSEKISILFSTIPDEEIGALIARRLIELKVAACVNIVPRVRSIYSWNGKVCDDSEAMLIIKTGADKVDEVIATIKSLHPYETPEIIALGVDSGWPDYIQWVLESTSS